MKNPVSPARWLMMLLGLMLASCGALAESLPLAHEASPDIYSVLNENDEVIVLRMELAPGQSDALHRHNAETVYFERGGSLSIEPHAYSVFAAPMNVTVPDGHVMLHEAWAHRVRNIGDAPVIAVIIEQKR
ncbi:MAG: hypothetical protein P1U64_01350 [Alcanivoracaceae bacterium]|nr:hypothetical protein [Alcanivoracaceae bacterium]